MIDVAVDARVTRRMSLGVRAYVRELLERLPHAAPDLRIASVGHGENFGLREQFGLPREIARSGAKMAHFPTTYAPLLRRRPYALTVHDLIHLRFPQLFGPATALHYRLVGGPLARGAARLLVGDERTVADCQRFLGVDPERCRVVPLGYDPAVLETGPPLVVDTPYFFYAGNHKPHKNLATLYAAWAALPSGVAIDLRITGRPDPQVARHFARTNGRVIFTGYLDSARLREHYRAALAYVHPALVEGFGIPMLEAAVVGTPVVASTGAISTVVAPFASTFAAADIDALAALLGDLVRDPAPYRARAAEGSATLRAYTWDRFAAGTAAVYREVIECS
jgi:glycosyltransferase involved in cell wall biosynthesis